MRVGDGRGEEARPDLEGGRVGAGPGGRGRKSQGGGPPPASRDTVVEEASPDWRYNRPGLSRRNAVAGLSVGAMAGLGALVAFALGSDLWLALLAALLVVSPPFVLVAYWTGPSSGWRGAWSLAAARPLDDVLPDVLRALGDAHLEARVTAPGRAPRWLRNARALVETREGFRVWLIPGKPGGAAGLSPRLQPLTTVVVDSTAVSAPHNTRRLRALLAGPVRGVPPPPG